MEMTNDGNVAVGNMIALAFAISRLRNVKIVLAESGFASQNVEEALRGHSRTVVAEPFAYIDGEGMDYLMKQSRHGMLSERTVMDGIVSIKDRLGFVPTALKRNRTAYEMQFGKECQNILQQLNKIADYVFIYCDGIAETIKKQILKQADLVVVNVVQAERVLDEYFSCPPYFRYKSLYCIGNYMQEEPYNLKNIQRLYRIEEQHIGMIPYNVEFLSSLRRGKMLYFFEGYPMKARYNRNKGFFKELFKMAEIILRWKGGQGIETED